MRPIELGFVVCALAAAVPASAQVYRWVDDRGVVNYAAKPPGDGRQTVRLDLQASRLSIIPTALPAPLTPPPAAAALPPAPASFPGLVDQATVGALSTDWRERCIARRRVDCDSPTAATFDFAPALGQNAPPAFGPRSAR